MSQVRVYVLICAASFLLYACSGPAPKPDPVPRKAPPAPPAKVEPKKPDPPKAVPQEVAAERARQFIGELAAGKYDKAFAMMTVPMQKALPAAKLEQLWIGLQAKLGFFEDLGKMRFMVKGLSHVVRVVANYEDIPMDLIVSVDPKIQVEGFFIKMIDLPRPQTPKPPLPYTQREVLYENPTDKSKLGGTLTIPRSSDANKRHPAVLLITGSGPQDRDETIFGHKPFFVIADRLTRDGFVVLRVDDRGVGKSTGKLKQATEELFATDVAAGVAFLKKQAEVDPKKVGLLGHSEGGIIAPMVAADRKQGIAFVVSMAGPGVPGKVLSPMQIGTILKAQGKLPADAIKKVVAIQKKVQALALKKGDHKEKIIKLLKEGFAVAVKHAPEKHKKLATPTFLAAQLQTQLATMATPWFKSFMTTDPARHWRKVKCPVLLLNGDKDLQVPADVNLKKVVKALKRARNEDVTARKLAGLNHLFQKAKTGLIVEYAQLDETFDTGALDLIAGWMKKRFVK